MMMLNKKALEVRAVKPLYERVGILAKVRAFFIPYFTEFTKPTADKLIWLLVAMLVVGQARSIRSLHTEFLKDLDIASLQALYYAVSDGARPAKLGFMHITAKLALGIRPDELKECPCFLLVDDTLVPKFGRKFAHVGVLFDHADHDGKPYKNGHCFVCIALCVPIGVDEDGVSLKYLSLPLVLRLWVKGGTSKLEIAHDLLIDLRDSIAGLASFIVECDAWYPKSTFVRILNEWPGLDMIAAVRSDTAMYDRPPKREGKPKRGRPRKYGDKLTVHDFILTSCGLKDYVAGSREVITKLFPGRTVTAFVTAANSGKGSRRLYLSTLSAAALLERYPALAGHFSKEAAGFEPLHLYGIRWSIETAFYELKTMWSLEQYMVRSARGIDMLVNLIITAYDAMKLLPYTGTRFSHYQGQSAQTVRLGIGQTIRCQLILARLAQKAIKTKMSRPLKKALCKLIGSFSKAA